MKALQESPTAKACLKAWYPPEAGIIDKIESIRAQHPDGFRIVDNISKKP